MLFKRCSVTGLTPEYERKLTPLKSSAADTVRGRLLTSFTSRLLLTGKLNAAVEKLKAVQHRKLFYRLAMEDDSKSKMNIVLSVKVTFSVATNEPDWIGEFVPLNGSSLWTTRTGRSKGPPALSSS